MNTTETVTRETKADQAVLQHYLRLGWDGRPFPGPDGKFRALCGAEVKRIYLEHSGSICQPCVDAMRGQAS